MQVVYKMNGKGSKDRTANHKEYDRRMGKIKWGCEMYPRTEYEMSHKDLEKLLEASTATPVISFGGMESIGSSPQENANNAWENLGKKMGFDSMTVKPISRKGERFFTAVPSETPIQRKEREDKEVQEAKAKKVEQLKKEIDDRNKELEELEGK